METRWPKRLEGGVALKMVIRGGRRSVGIGVLYRSKSA